MTTTISNSKGSEVNVNLFTAKKVIALNKKGAEVMKNETVKIESLKDATKKEVKFVGKAFKALNRKATTSPSYWAGYFARNLNQIIEVEDKKYKFSDYLAKFINLEGNNEQKQTAILKAILSGYKFYTADNAICIPILVKDKDSHISIYREYVKREKFMLNDTFNAITTSTVNKVEVIIGNRYDELTPEMLEAKKLESKVNRIAKLNIELSNLNS